MRNAEFGGTGSVPETEAGTEMVDSDPQASPSHVFGFTFVLLPDDVADENAVRKWGGVFVLRGREW